FLIPLFSTVALPGRFVLRASHARPEGETLEGAPGGRNDPGRTTPVPSLLFGATAALFRWNLEMLGTETLLVLAIVVAAAFLAFHHGSPRAQIAAGLLAAAAMALRLDAALAAAAIGLVLWVRDRRPPLPFAAAGLVPLSVWLAWLTHLFGTFLPNTWAAKRAELSLSVHGYTVSQWLWLRRSLPLPACAALLGLAAAGLVVGLRSGLLRRPFFAALGLWVALHEIVYRLAGVPFAPWYEEALLQAVLFLAVLAAVALGARLAALLRRGLAMGSREAIGWGFAVLALLPILAPSLADLGRQWGRAPDPRFAVYEQVGRFLARDAAGSPDATVAASEIGVVGYVSRLRVLDLGGLISPQVLAARAAGHLPDLLAAARPDYLVDVPAFRERGLAAFLARPEATAAYRPVAAFTSPEYGGGTVRVWRRE
ncbi:MAG TPA: hypothetical protein VOA87_12930, partial [Thermoanaerobaculia bacterium]|nr:hypothetical protein [Thermoanaerobaculia bacterium]